MVMASDPLPPPQPAFILRGHSAQIHALHFTSENKRLLTADAEGWLVSWNLSYKRPAAVWRAHTNAILGLGSWGPDRIVTHGRDNELLVWELKVEEEGDMDKTLPVDGSNAGLKRPWLLYALPVNALNFCPFAMCYDGMPQGPLSVPAVEQSKPVKPILLAVPNAIDSGGVDIFQLPSRRRVAMISGDRSVSTGMVMALSILADTARIQLAAGYESGHTMVLVQSDPAASFEKIYVAQPHTQPVLSLALSPCRDHYVTSSADANIAKNPFPSTKSVFKTGFKPIKVVPTKHSGQQGASYRSDGKVFATAGWDSATRVYSGKTLKEVAVLKWHKEGCYATAFASVNSDHESMDTTENEKETEVSDAGVLTTQASSTLSVLEKRDLTARTAHWLAVGSKDGKVSLWDIF